MKKTNESLENALEYMCNLPKIYVEELDLNGAIFMGIMGHICDLAKDNGEKDEGEREKDSDVPKYMPLQYDVVQKYCVQGFPTKYVCSHYGQYCRTINAAILVYYKILRSDKCELSDEEYEKMFGSFFLDKRILKKLNKDDILGCFEPEEQEQIETAKLAGEWQKKFEENWKKKRSRLLENQIEKGQIIRDNLFLEDEFNTLADEGATLKRVINFLDKLENEGHEKSANSVLIPYEEYHALHDMLAERPGEKAILQEKHAKLIHKLERVFNFEAKKKV